MVGKKIKYAAEGVLKYYCTRRIQAKGDYPGCKIEALIVRRELHSSEAKKIV